MGNPIQIPPVTITMPRRSRRDLPSRDQVMQETHDSLNRSIAENFGGDDIDSAPSMLNPGQAQPPAPDPGTRDLVIPRVDPDREESIDDSLTSPHASVQAISAPTNRGMRIQQPEGIDSAPQRMMANPLNAARRQVGSAAIPSIATPSTDDDDIDATPQAMWEPDPVGQQHLAAMAPAQTAPQDDLDATPRSILQNTPQEQAALEEAQRHQRRNRILGGIGVGLGGALGIAGAITGNTTLANVGSGIAGGGGAIGSAKPADAVQANIQHRQQLEMEQQDRDQRSQMLQAQLQQQGLQAQLVNDQMQQRQFDREQGQNAALGSYRQYRSLLGLVPADQRQGWDVPAEQWPQSPEEARRLLDDLQAGFSHDRRGTHWIGGGASPMDRGLTGGNRGVAERRPNEVASSVQPGTERAAGDDIVSRMFTNPEERIIARAEVAAGFDPQTSDGLDAIRAAVFAYRHSASGGQQSILQTARDRLRGYSGATPQLQTQIEHLDEYMNQVRDSERTVRQVESPLSRLNDDQVAQVVRSFVFQNGHASLIGDAEVLGFNPEQVDLSGALTHMFNVTLKQRSGAAVTPNELARLINEFASVQGVMNPRRMLTFVHQLGEAASEDAARARVVYADAWDEYARRQSQLQQRERSQRGQPRR